MRGRGEDEAVFFFSFSFAARRRRRRGFSQICLSALAVETRARVSKLRAHRRRGTYLADEKEWNEWGAELEKERLEMNKEEELEVLEAWRRTETTKNKICFFLASFRASKKLECSSPLGAFEFATSPPPFEAASKKRQHAPAWARPSERQEQQRRRSGKRALRLAVLRQIGRAHV